MFLNGGSGKDKLTGGAGADTIYGLGGDDSLSGLGGEDVLAGNDGNDTLSGGGNDDYLMGGLGNDRIDGGTGFDWAGYEDATSAVKVDLALTTAQNTLGAGTDQLISIEYVHGSSYADTLMGTSGANYIFGGAGNDQLFGRAGDDFLAGGEGNDTVDGGIGIDTVSFDDGVEGGAVVSLARGTASGHTGDRLAAMQVDHLVSIENVYGSAYSDNISGDSGSNYIFGGAGDDLLWADGAGLAPTTRPSGLDVLEGGDGDDWLAPGQATHLIANGGDGVDLVFYYNGGDGSQLPGIKVDLSEAGPQNIDASHVVTLSSVEGVYATDSNDTLAASADKNLLAGVEGADLYIFRSLAELGNGEGADEIQDSFSDDDKIDLSAIDADTTTPGDQAFQHFSLVRGGGASNPPQTFTGQAGEIIQNYIPGTGSSYLLQFDVDGDAQADGALWVLGVGASDANFIL